MQLLQSFRLSIYLTLAIACLCLGYAEGTLLPESPYITAGVLVVLIVAYRLEGRWSLSLNAANAVGAGLIFLLVGWITFQFVRKPTPLMEAIPLPASLLPYLGPVLMILIPAKLFRPKHRGDFWTMQGIGLLAVALGCAMANDLYFGVLLIAYLVCFAWSLSLFYLYREVRPQESAAPAHSHGVGRPYLFRTTLRWSAAVAAVGLLLFLVTPRPNDSKWELPMAARGKMETGAADGNLDLNRTGSVEPNKEIAFEVYADDADGRPKLDLNPSQRWRTAVLSHYDNGKWLRDRLSGLTLLEKSSSFPRPLPGPRDTLSDLATRNARLPDFGPNAVYLTYKLQANSGSWTVLADPVQWRPNDAPPVLLFGVRGGAVQQRPDGNFEWLGLPLANRPTHVQVIGPSTEPELGPPMRATSSYQDFLTRLPQSASADRLRRWTSQLLQRLVGEGQLPSEAVAELDPFTRQPLAKHHEAIAHALEAYLARSGEFTYSLELQRKDRSIDPVEDFLYNTKSGHCQRFATALALILRSQGIPAQLVLGFRGCESRGDGWYDVRQYHAHAWVEVVIVRSPPADTVPRRPGSLPVPPGSSAVHLLTLDPTPAGDAAADSDSNLGNWFENTLAKGESFFKNFILAYDSNAREKAFNQAVESFEDFGESLVAGDIPWPAAAVGGVVLLGLGRVALRRRRRLRAAATALQQAQRIVPFHARLLALLAAHDHQPLPGETAREFTRRVASDLANVPTAAGAADVPVRIAEAYYRVRFGGHQLSADELRELDEALNQLATALDRTPHGG